MDQRRDEIRKRNNFYSPYKRSKNNETNRIQNFRNFVKLDVSNALIYIHPFSSYNKPWPEMGRPMEIGVLPSEKRLLEIEKNENKKLDFEKTGGIKFLALPKICENLSFDLKIGLEKFVHHIPHQNGIDQLLRWILSNKEKVTQKNKTKPLKLDFVCWRGLLTTMSVSAYDKFKDWKFSIILYRGTYYLCEIETDSQREQRINPDQKTKSFTYWGHKFETYITSDFPGDDGSGPDEVPDPDNNFSTIVSNSIGNHKLMYGAEVDCCFKDTHKELRDYCEIKSSRGDSIRDLNFERNQKFLKWWLQSYLVGIELIKVGLRNDDGIISKIIDCKVDDLLAPNRWWKENICLNLMNEILDSIKKFCTEENHVYIASREMNANLIRISKPKRNSEEFEKNYFLRDWFKDSLQSNNNMNTNEPQNDKNLNKNNITKQKDQNKSQEKKLQNQSVNLKKNLPNRSNMKKNKIQEQQGQTIPQIIENETIEKINMTSEPTNLMQKKVKDKVKKKRKPKKSKETIIQAAQQKGQKNKQEHGQAGQTIFFLF
ncbi:decapping and exoribonuclease [Brachionus plicatilis]|uniref:Decapping nuclease n=1 Tax=Brachionus plicatilis TaxID=10195 RepID=A0A3M7Q817_BRAPC|nr:decapping and exoribonuclease [Brachionus plicatilis]